MSFKNDISTHLFCLLTLCLLSTHSLGNSPIDPVLEEGKKRLEMNQKSQEKVSGINDETLALISEFDDLMKVVDGLNAYNQMMEKQLNRQQREIGSLRQSIQDVAVIERQILPLLSRMLDGLQEFIKLDSPFLLEERFQRLDGLRKVLERVDVSVAEKTRRVFEAYQIETEYGRTIEAYREKIVLDDGVFDADVLRIGRVSLSYRTLGSGKMGYWNKELKQWQTIDSSLYRNQFEKSLKVAHRELAPELLTVPVNFQ